jgi:hypothetical protein
MSDNKDQRHQATPMSMWEHVTPSVAGFNRSSPSGGAKIFVALKAQHTLASLAQSRPCSVIEHTLNRAMLIFSPDNPFQSPSAAITL